MKTNITQHTSRILSQLTAGALALGLTTTALAQGTTAFTYQGRLTDGANPATGTYDLSFTLYDSAGGVGTVGSPVSKFGTGITNGLFTVALDFGAGLFNGAARWLEIAAKTNGASAYVTLVPRQPLMPSPYALFAPNAGSVAGTNITGIIPLTRLPAAVLTNNQATVNLGGSFAGNGAGLTSVNAATLGGLGASGFWGTSGNAGTTPGTHFLGTPDNLALELKVNSQRALRLEPNASGPSLIGGAANNSIATYASVIGGGWQNTIQTNAYYAMIGGGRNNIIEANAHDATIAGGYGNSIQDSAYWTTIGGGYSNTLGLATHYSTIAGGRVNTIQAGGENSAIGGGYFNTIEGADNATIAGGAFNMVLRPGVYATIGGGDVNTNGGTHATISGGYYNTIETNANYTTIGGGRGNAIQSGSFYSTVAGGNQNVALGDYAAIPGGFQNEVFGMYSLAAGNRAKADHSGTFVWADATEADFASTAGNQFLVRASGGVGINTNNPAGAALNVAGTLLATAFQGNGASLASLNASNLASGIVPLARLPGEVVTNNEAGLALGGTFSGNGNGLTNLNATSLTSGSVPLARLPGEVVTNHETAVTIGGAFTGAFSGNGIALTNLNADALTGIVQDKQLSTNVARSSGTWSLYGNSDTDPGVHFVGTTDTTPLVLRVRNFQALRITPNDLGYGPNLTVGNYNTIVTNAYASSIGGGTRNSIFLDSSYSVICGGYSNTINRSSEMSIIAGGEHNTVGMDFSGLVGAADRSVIGGGSWNTIWYDSGSSTIGGGSRNTIGYDSGSSTIGGGNRNSILSRCGGSTIAGGAGNVIGNNADASTISGGGANTNGGWTSTIGGGAQNRILTNAQFATISGGAYHVIQSDSHYATIAGGVQNTAGGRGSFAAGTYAVATNDGAFVWADSQPAEFASTAANQVSFRCLGGVRFTSGVAGVNQTAAWAPGTAGWSYPSDRELKEQLAPVDGKAVLEKLALLSITEWNFKGYAQRHIGPMAQDFHAAFPLNDSDTTLNDADLHGVALAAIQGLDQTVKEKDAEIQVLKARLDRLEQLINARSGGAK